MSIKLYIKIFISLLTLVFILSCSSSTSPLDRNNSLILNDTNFVKLNSIICNSDENLKIIFLTLLEDSRCPIGAVCFWEGNAKAEIAFIINDENHFVELNTYNDFQRDTTLGNYYLELIDVLPYPILDDSHLDEDYIIKIFVSKNE